VILTNPLAYYPKVPITIVKKSFVVQAPGCPNMTIGLGAYLLKFLKFIFMNVLKTIRYKFRKAIFLIFSETIFQKILVQNVI